MSAELDAYREAMDRSDVPREPLAVYDSCSWRRVGLKSGFATVMQPTVAKDGHPDIQGDAVLRAMVAAFNAMLPDLAVAGLGGPVTAVSEQARKAMADSLRTAAEAFENGAAWLDGGMSISVDTEGGHDILAIKSDVRLVLPSGFKV